MQTGEQIQVKNPAFFHPPCKGILSSDDQTAAGTTAAAILKGQYGMEMLKLTLSSYKIFVQLQHQLGMCTNTVILSSGLSSQLVYVQNITVVFCQ